MSENKKVRSSGLARVKEFDIEATVRVERHKANAKARFDALSPEGQKEFLRKEKEEKKSRKSFDGFGAGGHIGTFEPEIFRSESRGD